MQGSVHDPKLFADAARSQPWPPATPRGLAAPLPRPDGSSSSSRRRWPVRRSRRSGQASRVSWLQTGHMAGSRFVVEQPNRSQASPLLGGLGLQMPGVGTEVAKQGLVALGSGRRGRAARGAVREVPRPRRRDRRGRHLLGIGVCYRSQGASATDGAGSADHPGRARPPDRPRRPGVRNERPGYVGLARAVEHTVEVRCASETARG